MGILLGYRSSLRSGAIELQPNDEQARTKKYNSSTFTQWRFDRKPTGRDKEAYSTLITTNSVNALNPTGSVKMGASRGEVDPGLSSPSDDGFHLLEL